MSTARDTILKAGEVLVVDGGFSSQVSRLSGHSVDGDPLWSARFLETHPEQVAGTHLDFLRAGADVIITDTYQASVGGFVKHLGVSEQQGYVLIRRAVDLAKQARNTFLIECSDGSRRPPLIAGSVGPYGAYLHDGSEYSGPYANFINASTLREWHRPRIQTLIEAGVDLLAFETIPCLQEAEMLVELLKEYPGTRAWLSFSCSKFDKTLAHGENFQKAAVKCYDANPEQLLAVGANCCSPMVVSSLFKGINNDRGENNIPLVTYPNSGEEYTAKGWEGGEECRSLADFVPEWLELGVRIVGGCCRTYDTDVMKIRAHVLTWLADRDAVND